MACYEHLFSMQCGEVGFLDGIVPTNSGRTHHF